MAAYEGWIKGLIYADELEFGVDKLGDSNSNLGDDLSFSINGGDEEHSRRRDSEIIRG